MVVLQFDFWFLSSVLVLLSLPPFLPSLHPSNSSWMSDLFSGFQQFSSSFCSYSAWNILSPFLSYSSYLLWNFYFSPASSTPSCKSVSFLGLLCSFPCFQALALHFCIWTESSGGSLAVLGNSNCVTVSTWRKVSGSNAWLQLYPESHGTTTAGLVRLCLLALELEHNLPAGENVQIDSWRWERVR